MPDLDAIAETLRRQRQDLEEMLDSTSTRRAEAAELVGRIEELRERAERTSRLFAEAEAAQKRGGK